MPAEVPVTLCADLWFLLSKEVALDWKMVGEKMKLYKKTASRKDIVERVRAFDEHQLKSDLQKFLSASDRKMIPHLRALLSQKLSDQQDVAAGGRWRNCDMNGMYR